MSEEKNYTLNCFCGDVQINVTGNPVMSGYCHCNSCREWSAAPMSTFAFWKPENVVITKGEDKVHSYIRSDKSYRKSCKTCGGHLFTDFKPAGMFNVYPLIISELDFEPQMHVHYQESVISIKDGLPKYKDVPRGSGELMPE